jgi:hypothetical protein
MAWPALVPILWQTVRAGATRAAREILIECVAAMLSEAIGESLSLDALKKLPSGDHSTPASVPLPTADGYASSHRPGRLGRTIRLTGSDIAQLVIVTRADGA